MSSECQFDDYMASATEALEDANTDTALDWVNQALSLRKHLDDEAIAQAYQLKAEILLAEEEHSEAEEALRKSLELFGRNAEGYVLLGELMLLEDRLEEATSAFESALETAPQNVHAPSLLIFCHAQSGNHAAAKECFDKCIELGPELADAYHHKAICLLTEGNPEANEFFEKALSKDPVLSGPHYYLGKMKIAEGDFAGAEEELQKELELNPANSLAEFQLIRSYLLNVPWPEATEMFDQHFPPEAFCDIPALRSCRFHFNYDLLNEKFGPFIAAVMKELPQTPQNLFHVAKIYRYKSLFGDAVEMLKKVMEADRRFRPAYAELAEVYRTQQELGRACDVLEESVALFGDAEAHCALGRVLFQSRRYSEAEETIRKAVSSGPDLAEPHYLLGAVLAEFATRRAGSEDMFVEAEESLQTASAIDPHHKPTKTYLMHVTFQQKKYDECLQLAQKVLSENAEDQAALSYSGRCFQATGELAQAEEQFTKLVELYPDDQAGRGMLAEAYHAQGKSDQAAEQLEQAIAIPGRRPPPNLLFRLGEIYLLHLNEPAKAREHLIHFLQTAPPGHPNFDRAKELLAGIKP